MTDCCDTRPKVVFLDQYRWRRTGRQLRRKLGEFADLPAMAGEVSLAQDLYLGVLDVALADTDDEFTMERCFEWFIFDYRMPGGKTVIRKFMSRGGLSSDELQLLKLWSSSRLSLYEVESVFPKGVQLKDILRLDRVTVNDVGMDQDIEVGSLLFMRILPVGTEWEFSTSGLALPPTCKTLLIRRLYNDIKNFWQDPERRGKTDLDYYLHERSHVINAWVMELGLTAEIPQLIVNESGENLGLTLAEDGVLGNLPSEIIEKITNVLLDGFYDQWVDLNLPALGGKTPRLACRTERGRHKVEELLLELELMENTRARKDEPSYDVNKLRRLLSLDSTAPRSNEDVIPFRTEKVPAAKGSGDFQWVRSEYHQVAQEIELHLHKLGYSDIQIEKALELWSDYSTEVHPNFRKYGVWVAAIIYAIARLEFDGTVNQHELAANFNVAVSTISSNFRLVCRALNLVAFDERYSTQKSPLDGIEDADPELAQILGNLRL